MAAPPVIFTRKSLSTSMTRSPPRRCTVTGSPALQYPFFTAAATARAGSRAARPRLAASALPYAHFQMTGVDHLYKFGVYPLRKHRMMLKERPRLFQSACRPGRGTNVTACGFPMETHVIRYGSPPITTGASDDGRPYPQGPGSPPAANDAFPISTATLSTFPPDTERERCLIPLSVSIGKLRFLRHFVVIEIFSDAADGVAAHLPLAAVEIEHPHFGVCRIRAADQNEPVCAERKSGAATSRRRSRRDFAALPQSSSHKYSRCRTRAFL